MCRIIYIVILSIACHLCQAQRLVRRPLLGIQAEKLTADVRRVMSLPDSLQGLLIDKVILSSTAENAGFQKGDVLHTINHATFATPTDLIQYISRQESGTAFSYELIRNGRRINGQAVLMPYPKEKYNDLSVSYTEVQTPSGQQRMIITRLRHARGRLPVVMFITGIGCYSLDVPLDTSRSEVQLLNRLARAGYMTVRVEKPGMGDNAGHSTPCDKVGFNEEVAGYVTAVRALKQRPDVNRSSIYIFGHSMGGVMAPLVAEQEPVKGIIAYGTIGSDFLDYLAKTRHTVGEAMQMEPDSIDDYVKEYCECAVYYFAEGMTTAEAAGKSPGCKDYLSVFDARSRDYNREMYQVNIPAAWRAFSGKALLLWGESDYISAKEDHEIITATVNRYHPGDATFTVCPASGHGMQYAASFADAAFNGQAPYNDAVGKTVLHWLEKNESAIAQKETN